MNNVINANENFGGNEMVEVNTYNYENIMNVLGQTTELVQSNAQSTAAIMADLQRTNSVLGHVAKTVEEYGTKFIGFEDRMTTLELSEEITTEQNENISTAVKRRLFDILNGDELDIQKYYRIFAQRLYGNARKYAGMGSKVSRTRKRDYQRVLDYVEAWTPVGGCASLKMEADIKAKARLFAKQNGYIR